MFYFTLNLYWLRSTQTTWHIVPEQWQRATIIVLRHGCCQTRMTVHDRPSQYVATRQLAIAAPVVKCPKYRAEDRRCVWKWSASLTGVKGILPAATQRPTVISNVRYAFPPQHTVFVDYKDTCVYSRQDRLLYGSNISSLVRRA